MTKFFATLIVAVFTACVSTPSRVAEAPVPAETKSAPAQSASARNGELVLNHRHFTIYFDPGHRLARYVKYSVTARQLRSRQAKRGERFFADPKLPPRLAVGSRDYAGSGYDRGHLAPAADFAFSQEASDDSFVMSNMAPQSPGLNRRAWKRLEEQVRRWACGEEKVTVITGPVLRKDLKRLPSGVPIPRHFFKIVVDETPPRKVLAFLYSQTDRESEPADRVVPVAEIEAQTELRFEGEIGPELPSVRIPAQISEWKEADCG